MQLAWQLPAPASAAEQTQDTVGWQRSLRQQQRPPEKHGIISTQGQHMCVQ